MLNLILYKQFAQTWFREGKIRSHRDLTFLLLQGFWMNIDGISMKFRIFESNGEWDQIKQLLLSNTALKLGALYYWRMKIWGGTHAFLIQEFETIHK